MLPSVGTPPIEPVVDFILSLLAEERKKITLSSKKQDIGFMVTKN